MVDYRRFLAPKPPVVLPYFGGTRVDAPDRRFRISGELAPGWWRFRIDGRRAEPVEPAEPAGLDGVPIARGHWACGWIAIDGQTLARVALPPDDEPPPLTRLIVRRWYSGDHVFDALEFEDDAELEARHALEQHQPLGALRGVVPSLRTAFGLALGSALASELGAQVSIRELVPQAVAIADHGRAGMRAWLDELAAGRQRAEAEARRRAETIRLQAAAGTARALGHRGDPVDHADDALDGARARMLSCRRLDRGARLGITYEVDGERIMSIVDATTLQVIDPGICLGHGGEFRALTLDAMPSVVREAIETGGLNITRHA